MFDPFNYEKVMRYLTWTFILIIFMIVTGMAVAGEQILHSKIKTISPDKVDGQYCFIKVEIVQEDNTITKREVLECADGKKGIETPGYWELFAQFYYRDVATPEYCRYYSRDKHAFKTPGKVCLMLNGEWEVR
tara:strand:+ start:23 stop:421 length:399 start_codon:yes stop_codon:yes gene_type:complete